jgi:hypothetical protein
MRGYEAPSIGARLRPLIPFFIWWTIITSLLLHLLQERKRGEAELDRAAAQESVLRALLERFEAGEVVPDAEIRQQLEMVGLRKRQDTGTLGEELGKVSWWEVMLGRKRQQEVVVEEVESVADKTDEEVVQELGKSESGS